MATKRRKKGGRRFISEVTQRDALRRLMSSMNGAMIDLMRFSAQMGQRDWKELTSGTTSTRELRRRGHPFGRNEASSAAPQILGNRQPKVQIQRGRSGMRPLPINKQKGRLQAGLIVLNSPNRVRLITRGVPYAEYQLSKEGTRKMQGRGLRKAMQMRAKARHRGIVESVLRQRLASL